MTKPLNELTVVQANDFIQQTNWAMDKVPLKLFKALIAAIDIKNPPKNNTVVVSKAELIKLLDTSGHNYVYLKRRMRQLVTAVKVDGSDDEERYVALVQDIYWKIDSDEVRVTFHEAVMPYLIGLKSRFLQYPAANINQFKSKYGLIIYEYLLSKERQYNFGVYGMSVDEIRQLTGTEKTYSMFRDFDKKVIQTATEDINQAGVEILVKNEKVKRGRKIVNINFYVRARNSYRDTEYDVINIRPNQIKEYMRKEK
ncbi:replication initiation protein [Gemella sanguinis]|jgi:plasmid replication initiation protein|uniref:replication initiation protein n=1 Tax=Gemella sanguinis TaxID=84135 RepID=UPI0028D2B0E1|nr:replication initiation protein [Gemella sanguinis]